jgi:hypothetical protein
MLNTVVFPALRWPINPTFIQPISPKRLTEAPQSSRNYVPKKIRGH